MSARDDYPTLGRMVVTGPQPVPGSIRPRWRYRYQREIAAALTEIDELRYQKSRLQAEKTALLQQVAYR